jgi:hypothetical protein
MAEGIFVDKIIAFLNVENYKALNKLFEPSDN